LARKHEKNSAVFDGSSGSAAVFSQIHIMHYKATAMLKFGFYFYFKVLKYTPLYTENCEKYELLFYGKNVISAKSQSDCTNALVNYAPK
jgi:hypothetical protein